MPEAEHFRYQDIGYIWKLYPVKKKENKPKMNLSDPLTPQLTGTIYLWLILSRSHHLSSYTLPTLRERRKSCDETGVLDEDDPHFVRGPGTAPHSSSGVCLLCVCMLRAVVDGGRSALWSDTISC